MANDLSTPLTGRKRKPGQRPHLPIARMLFGVLALIAVAFVLRLVLTDDPNGGRPSAEVAITSTRNGNQVANEVSTGPVTITADPQQYPANGSAPPDAEAHASGSAVAGLPNAFGALPDLSEETSDGPIPRIATSCAGAPALCGCTSRTLISFCLETPSVLRGRGSVLWALCP